MIISRSDYDRSEYKFKENVFETHVLNTSIKFDINNLIVNIKGEYLSEYEKFIKDGYDELIKKLESRDCDAFYNFDFGIRPLDSGIVFLYASCDGVTKL